MPTVYHQQKKAHSLRSLREKVGSDVSGGRERWGLNRTIWRRETNNGCGTVLSQPLKGQGKTFTGDMLLCFSFLTRGFCQGGRQTEMGGQVMLSSSLNAGKRLSYLNNRGSWRQRYGPTIPFRSRNVGFLIPVANRIFNKRIFLTDEWTCSSSYVPRHVHRCYRKILCVHIISGSTS